MAISLVSDRMTGGSEMKTTYGVIWKILNELDIALDIGDYNPLEELTPERFGISENRFSRYLQMLQSAGYIDGVDVREFTDGNRTVSYSGIEITLEGIQFLLENSMMRKIAAAAERMGLIVAEAGVGAAGAAVAAKLGK